MGSRASGSDQSFFFQPTILAKMDRHLMLVLNENSVPESFQEWMLAAGLITPFDFGIVVKERDNLDNAIVSYNIPGFVQDDMAAIREAWLVCRGIADQEIGDSMVCILPCPWLRPRSMSW